ncbi:MAG TPA: glycoside hydrolase family 44 protein [Ktedonobacterales bacterium]|jgi:hypothetical protein
MTEPGQQQYDFGDEDLWAGGKATGLEDRISLPPEQARKRFRRRTFLLGLGALAGGLLIGGAAGYRGLSSLIRRPRPNYFTLTGALTTPNDLVIYSNGKLSDGWEDWSWANHDFASKAQLFTNQPSLRMELANWGALHLHRSAGSIDLTDFGYLQFYVNGDNGSDQQVFAFFAERGNGSVQTTRTLTAPYTQGGGISSSDWKLTRLPLAAMKATKQTISGVLIEDASGGEQPAIYIADLRLIYAPDLTPAHIAQALALDLNTITLIFNKRLLPEDAQSSHFYTISGADAAYATPQAPLSAHYHVGAQSVSMVVPTPLRANQQYTVTIGPVRDNYGVALPDPSHATVTVTTHPLTVKIDAAQNQRAISPLIYGVSQSNADWMAEGRPRLNRWGGNQATRYNWELGNAFNAAGDYYFTNGTYGHDSAADKRPSGMADQFIEANNAIGAATMLTIPNIGWVARDRSSQSDKVPEEGGPPLKPGGDAIAGYDPRKNRQLTSVSSKARKNGALSDPPDLNDSRVAQNEWVAHLLNRFGPAQNGGVRFYAMDNEPDLWSFTHTDIHPAELSYDQLRDIFLDYATAVKEIDPTALVTGPVLSGWVAYFYSPLDRGKDNFRTHADKQAHGGQDFLPWWLSQIRAHDERTGQRSLDVLDIHYYPQGGEYSNDVSPKLSAQRLQAVRSLWDPTYTDASWINQKVQLIPRMKQWIQEYYPGTRLGITEWNFGAEGHMNGALALAEALGVFGREGLDLASYWAYPAKDSPAYFAWRLFTNYDGRGSAFGATSVQALSSDANLVSCYASLDSATGDLLGIVLNKSAVADLTPTIQIANMSATQAHVYQISEDTPQIKQLQTVSVSGGALKLLLPASSITLLRFTR